MCSLGISRLKEPAEGVRHRRATTRRRAVLLIHLGTPSACGMAAVRRYVAAVLGDADAVPLPRGFAWLNPILGGAFAGLRTTRPAEGCQKIWTDGGSPPLWTFSLQQASALESKLPDGMRVFCAMRYGRPGIAETLRQVASHGVEELVVVPMYPQYSAITTRTIVRELYRQLSRSDCRIDITMRSTWYDDTGYVNAHARLIHEYATAHGLTPDNTRLVFSLRSLPASRLKRGDPYTDQIRRTPELVGRRLGWPSDRTSQGYHSPSGPVKWLRPTTFEVLADLSRSGEDQVLVCPLGFSIDCPETLGQIQIRCREQFVKEGGRFFACPAPNAFDPFIAALKNLVLYGRRPIESHEIDASLSAVARPHEVRVEEPEAPIDSLVMVGTSLRGRLGPSRDLDIGYAEPGQFRNIRNPQCAVPDMLRAVCEDGVVREALLWNTCRRFEFYGWLKTTTEEAERAETIANVRRLLFDHNAQADTSVVNVLRGADAWYYLLRTAAGLNSGLPGEREVLQQLHGARRLAERAGTAGPLMGGLVADVSEYERNLREQTEWGTFKPDYCYASISQIVRSTGLDLADCRCLVIGGSTTSCGILEVLAERFGVSRRQLTLLHRGHSHGGHLKMLRRAIGNGRRTRVHKYNETAVIRAIAEADVVFFGLDRKVPVLDAEQIRECRDFTLRPLVIIDFNLFGSTLGMKNLDGVRLWNASDLENAVAAFAEDMCKSDRFAHAARAAESWIRCHVPASLATGKTLQSQRPVTV